MRKEGEDSQKGEKSDCFSSVFWNALLKGVTVNLPSHHAPIFPFCQCYHLGFFPQWINSKLFLQQQIVFTAHTINHGAHTSLDLLSFTVCLRGGAWEYTTDQDSVRISLSSPQEILSASTTSKMSFRLQEQWKSKAKKLII